MRVDLRNVLFPVLHDFQKESGGQVSQGVALEESPEVNIENAAVELPKIVSNSWNHFRAFFHINMGAKSFESLGMSPSEHILFLSEALLLASQQDSALPDPAPTIERLKAVVIMDGNTNFETLLGSLKNKKKIDLYSGYTGRPGHAVWIHLQMVGEDQVEGYVVQTGEGIDYHGTVKRSKGRYRTQYLPKLLLGSIPLASLLEKPLFFQQLDRIQRDGLKETFNIHQFYADGLVHWPGAITVDQDFPTKGMQRGPTCSVKVFLRILEEDYGHCYPKIKFYLRVYSICGLFCRSVNASLASCAKLALHKTRNTFLKIHQQNILSNIPLMRSLLLTLTDKVDQLSHAVYLSRQRGHSEKQNIGARDFIVPEPLSQRMWHIRALDWEDLQSPQSLNDLHALRHKLKSLLNKEMAGRYALHVLSDLPVWHDWKVFGIDYAYFTPWIRKLIEAIQPDNEGRIILTPKHHATFKNLQGGFLKIADENEGPRYQKWIYNLFTDYTYKVHSDQYLLHLCFRSPERDLNDLLIQAILEDQPDLTAEQATRHDLTLEKKFYIPLQLSLLIFLTEHACLAHQGSPLTICHCSQNNAYGVSHIHYVHLRGIKKVINTNGIGWYSYFPWSDPELEFLNALHKRANPNQVVLEAQEGAFFGGALLTWEEIYLLRSITAAPFPRLPEFFDYLRFYPHRPYASPFRALCELLLDSILNSEKSVVTQLPVSQWVIEFFDHKISAAIEDSLLGQVSFFLRLFAKLQVHYPTTSNAWMAHLDRVLQTFIPDAMTRDPVQDEEQRLSFYYQIIALVPYLPHTSQMTYVLSKKLAQLLAFDPKPGLPIHVGILQEDFAKGCDLLQNPALHEDRQAITLPLSLLQHDRYPFKDRSPNVTLTQPSPYERIYHFIDSDGASATICHFLRTSEVKFSKVLDHQLAHLCYSFSDYQNAIDDSLYGHAWLMDRTKLSFWQSDDLKTIYIVDKTSHRTMAIWRGQHIYHPTGALILVGLHLYANHSNLLCLDEAAYTLPWSQENSQHHLELVEYPRLGLSFKREGKHYYENLPPHRQYIDQTVPELELWQHYVVVQDKDGLQSVLIPEATPKQNIRVEDVLSSKPRLTYSSSPRILCYPLSSAGAVLPSQNTYANLWLIALMLWQGHYEKAYRLTDKHLQHPKAWPQEERALLLPSGLFYPSSLNASSDSRHGILSAIRIRLVLAAYPFDRDLEKSLLTLVNKDYTNYLDQLNSVEGLLCPDEERRMLRLCRDHKTFGYPLHQREKDLFQHDQPTRCQDSNPGPPPIPANVAFPSIMGSFKVPEDLSTLIEQDLVQHHQQLADWIKKSQSEKEQQQFCSAMERFIFSSNPLAALAAAFLHQMTSSRSASPPPDDPKVYSYLQMLRNRAINKLPYRSCIQKSPSHSVRTPLFHPKSFILGHLPPLQLDAVVDTGALLSPLQGRGIVPVSLQPMLRRLEEIYTCHTRESCINHIFEEKQANIHAFRRSQCHRRPTYDAYHLEDKEVFEEVQSSLDLHIHTLEDKTQKARIALEVELQTRYSKDALDHRLPFPITLEEVVAYLVHEKYYDLVARFPSLENDLAHFRQQVASYLMLATELQHLQRAKKALSSSQEVQDPLIQQQAREDFLQVISLKRQYHHHKDESFTYLAIEWVTGKRLFSRQIKMARDLSDPNTTPCNAVAETGFGKSSLVIPLVLLLFSKRRHTIPVMTLPSALIEDEIRHLKGFLGNLGLSVYHVDFDRMRAQDIDQVHHLRSTMEGAKKTLFIMSMSTAQIISDLALKTDLLQNSSSPLRDELIKLKKLWAERVYNFVDESRELLGADEHIYAIGNRQPISWEHRTRAATFYREILLHEDILSKWHFSFLPHDDSHKKEVSEETYDELKNDLLLLMTHLLLQQDSPPCTYQAHSFLQGQDNSYLNYDDDLRYWKNQLNTYLPTTLKAKYGSRYQRDLSERSYLAIPCAAGVPRPSYEFACLDELINFTLQANLAEPLSSTFVHEFISTLASKIHSGESSQKDRTILKDLFKSALLERGVRTHQELLAFTQHLNGHLPDKLLFISIAVLGKIAPYSHKVASTSHTFVLSHKAHGASATATTHALPPVMTPRPRPKAGVRNLLSLLEKDAQIFLVTDYEAQEFLKASLQQDTHHVLIDQAGLFSHLDIEAIQKIVFQHRPFCQHLLFYDATGTLGTWNKGDAVAKKSLELPDLEKTFIYLPESKAVGTDLPMLPGAKLLITLDWRITQARLEQSLGRGRRLHQGQSADFVIGEKHWFMILDYLKKEKIRTDHTCGNLLRYASCQEGLQGSLEVYQSLYRYAQALLERQIFDAPSYEWESLVRNFSNLLTLPTELENPLLPEGKMLCQYDAIRQVRHSFFTPFYKACKRLSRGLRPYISFTELESKWEAYVAIEKKQLTRNLHTQTLNAGKEQAVCTQVESQRQTNSMTNQHQKKRIDFTPKLPSYSICPTLTIFDFKIKFSASFSYVSRNEMSEVNNIFKKPAYNYLLKVDPTKTICLAVIAGQKELSYALDKGYFYLKDHRVLARPSAFMDAPFPDLFSLVTNPIQAQQILILAKLLRREKNLSPQDWELLKKTKTTKALIDWAKATLDLTLIPR